MAKDSEHYKSKAHHQKEIYNELLSQLPPCAKVYLRDKDLAEDVLISDIVKAMPKVSCATLETVMNLAALNSTYQGHEHIYKDDVIATPLVTQLSWTNNLLILSGAKNKEERHF